MASAEWGVTLTAREIAHRLNNDLAQLSDAWDLLPEWPDLPPRRFPMIERAFSALESARRDIIRLHRAV